ncbi:MAG: FlgD immunoglobulin-like domain containing protein [Calditrichia bacterium]
MKYKATKFSVFIPFLAVLLFVGFAQAQFPGTGTLTGQVTLESTGEPLAHLVLTVSNNLLPIPIPVMTDSAGYYDMSLMKGTYTISLLDTSLYQQLNLTDVVITSGETTVQNISVTRKPPDAMIKGNVTLGGEPVEGAKVQLIRIPSIDFSNELKKADGLSLVAYSTTTDANGDFSLDIVHGNYFLYIPYGEKYFPYWSSELYVAAGDTINLSIDLTSNNFVKITGTVYNFEMFDMVFFAATRVDSTFRSSSFLADTSGNYKINVLSGQYLLSCTGILNGTPYTLYYGDVLSPDEATIVDAAKDTSGIDFAFPSNLGISQITVTGRVMDAETSEPIEGAKVRFEGENIGFNYHDTLHHYHLPAVMTDADGYYTVSGKTFLDSVTVIGYAKKDGYFAQFYDDQSSFFSATPITILAGDTAKGIDFSLTPVTSANTYSISGMVLGEDGQAPDYGAVIAHYGDECKYAETDAEGKYQIDGLPQDAKVILQAWGFPGYIPIFYDNAYSWKDATIITMDADKTIDFTLPTNNLSNSIGMISGKVTVSNQLQGDITLLVKKADTDNWYSADYADAKGQFNLPIESFGQYDLLATAPGYENYMTSVDVNNSTGLYVKNLEITLDPTSIGGENTGNVIRSNVLYSAYPNPFNPSTTIKVAMAKNEKVSLFVYNVLGQRVKTLFEGNLKEGAHEFRWDGKDDRNQSVASGLYFYQLKTETNIQTKNVIFMK